MAQGAGDDDTSGEAKEWVRSTIERCRQQYEQLEGTAPSKSADADLIKFVRAAELAKKLGSVSQLCTMSFANIQIVVGDLGSCEFR